MKCGRVNVPVNDVSNDATSCKSTNNSQRERRSWKSQTDTSNIHNSLKTFSQNGDERQNKHDMLLRPKLETTHKTRSSNRIFLIQSLHQLNPPLLLKFINSQKSSAHNRDNNRRNKTEASFPDVFCFAKDVFAEGVECTDHTGADADTDGEAETYTNPYLILC